MRLCLHTKLLYTSEQASLLDCTAHLSTSAVLFCGGPAVLVGVAGAAGPACMMHLQGREDRNRISAFVLYHMRFELIPPYLLFFLSPLRTPGFMSEIHGYLPSRASHGSATHFSAAFALPELNSDDKQRFMISQSRIYSSIMAYG